jgi:hypothetical protein
MALPVKTTVEDVREIVGYLRNKPTGASINEAKAAIRPQVLDGRKVAAYIFWDLVKKEGERLGGALGPASMCRLSSSRSIRRRVGTRLGPPTSDNLAEPGCFGQIKECCDILSDRVFVVRAERGRVMFEPLRGDVRNRHRFEPLVMHPFEG